MRSTSTIAPRADLLRAMALSILATAVSGCATTASQKFVWPPPPEKARIEYIRSFAKPGDLKPSFGRKLLNAIFPHDRRVAIASPLGVALSPDEKRLYVACGATGRLVSVDLVSQTMELVGDGLQPRLVSPVGVAVDMEGNVYVSDRFRGVVLAITPEEKLLRTFGEGRLERPTAVAIDRKARVLYVLNGAGSGKTDHRVEVFSLAGKHLRTLGKRGGLPGEFNFPTGLAVAPDGSLYVSDMLNFRVQQFDREGTLVSMFGQNGSGRVGAFDKMKGIGFDTFGNLYVVDSMQGVQVFSPAHQPLLLFAPPPFMSVPGALAIDSRNRIFVADFGINRVHEFQLVNTTAADSALRRAERPASETSSP